ncbi:MAG: ABC transporter permease, partial [Clostridia bacterium]|nr:ABC transporter permease [Clostridia bacterium]
TWTEGSTEHTYDVKVLGVADNYTFHYVYMTPYCYYQMTHGVAPTYNYLFCNTNPDLDGDEKAELEKAVNNVSGINGTVYTGVIVDSFSNIVRALNIIIYILIAAAMALAVVVLYNLNNININERVKELATLKVLGFYDSEVSSYIYRENIILTFFGVVLGLLAGVPFDMLVIRVIDIDALTFKTDIGWLGFVLACAVTLFFALVVNIKMHFNLKKISMVESLKSVE